METTPNIHTNQTCNHPNSYTNIPTTHNRTIARTKPHTNKHKTNRHWHIGTHHQQQTNDPQTHTQTCNTQSRHNPTHNGANTQTSKRANNRTCKQPITHHSNQHKQHKSTNGQSHNKAANQTNNQQTPKRQTQTNNTRKHGHHKCQRHKPSTARGTATATHESPYDKGHRIAITAKEHGQRCTNKQTTKHQTITHPHKQTHNPTIKHTHKQTYTHRNTQPYTQQCIHTNTHKQNHNITHNNNKQRLTTNHIISARNNQHTQSYNNN